MIGAPICRPPADMWLWVAGFGIFVCLYLVALFWNAARERRGMRTADARKIERESRRIGSQPSPKADCPVCGSATCIGWHDAPERPPAGGAGTNPPAREHSCDRLGVCQQRTPPCAGCTKPAAPPMPRAAAVINFEQGRQQLREQIVWHAQASADLDRQRASIGLPEVGLAANGQKVGSREFALWAVEYAAERERLTWRRTPPQA